MKKAFAVGFLLASTFAFGASAQAPQMKGDEQKTETNCPPTNPANAQAQEKSIILPDAEGEKESAAPTVQRDGQTVSINPACKQDPEMPDNKKKG
ncbi:MAG: hypothetical protein K2P86_06945 [Xanthobacteraceae bacterium]|nr:hypothetical protein [Xanthobacteraceae bacterium]